jgi:hypothetical protein
MSRNNDTVRLDFRNADAVRKGFLDSKKRAKRIAEGEKRAEELRLPKLPKGMASAMHAYSLTSQSRENSKHLDSLLKRGNAKP